MLQANRILPLLMAAALVVTCAAAWSADREPRIGVVDILRVTTEAPRMRQYAEEVAVFAQALNANLDIRDQHLLLAEAETNELLGLKSKVNPNAADKARIKALTDIERSRDDELKKLEQTRVLTDQQKARMKDLHDMIKKSKEAVEAVYLDSDAKLRAKEDELRVKANADISTAAATVAKLKRLDFIFAKNAVQPDGRAAAMLMFGGIDVTSDIIERLDRKGR